MTPEQLADQDAYFAALLQSIHDAEEGAAPRRSVQSAARISAKTDPEIQGISEPLNAILSGQQALFTFESCDPRHNNGRNLTAKQRNCD